MNQNNNKPIKNKILREIIEEIERDTNNRCSFPHWSNWGNWYNWNNWSNWNNWVNWGNWRNW